MLAETMPPIPIDSAFSSTSTRLVSDSASRSSSAGHGPEGLDRQTADLVSLLAQFVDHVLDRADHRAERDDDQVGVARPVTAKQTAGGPSELLLELGSDHRDPVKRLHLLVVRQVAHFRERLGPTIAPIVTGSLASSTCWGTNGGRKASTCSCVASSMRSTAWVRMKPSMQTITGSESSSARR